MATTLAPRHIRKPVRRAPVLAIVSDALGMAADWISPACYPGDPSPCWRCRRQGERMFPSPYMPGKVVCSKCGKPRRRAVTR